MNRIFTMAVAMLVLTASSGFAEEKLAVAGSVESVEAVTQFELIQQGDMGDSVRLLQEKLNELGLSAGKADGIFGPRTKRALIELQEALGMETTGTVETQADWNAIMVAVESDGVITSVYCENLLTGYGEDYVESNGVTFVKNADGSVTANGTAIGGNAVYMIMKRDQVISELAKYTGQSLIGVGCPEGGSTSESYWLNFQGFTGVGDGIGTPDTGSGSIFTADISEDYNTMQVYFAIHEGMTVENLIFAPVLCLNVE